MHQKPWKSLPKTVHRPWRLHDITWASNQGPQLDPTNNSLEGFHHILLDELYLESSYSLQPAGDTPDRAGFYDSIRMGCVPIITEISVDVYFRHLHHGVLWEDEADFRSTVVVWPDVVTPTEVEMLVEGLIEEINNGQTQKRRQRLLQVVDYLVYHDYEEWDTSPPDALHLMLNLLSESDSGLSNYSIS
eukprot:m.37453 g.37453  ORF g.37453 m.37453 type:complete len:189 (-) comp12503_c0_seq1:156-722(-)